MIPNAGHAPHGRMRAGPWVLPPDGRRRATAARMPSKGPRVHDAQDSELEDRGRAPTELTAQHSAATRTQARERSRHAGL
jgi:hypothetical protein